MNNKVKFLRGTSAEYAGAVKDEDTFYYTTDDEKFYIGSKEITSGDSNIATCTTGRATAAKVATLENFSLTIGATIAVKFTDTAGTANPASGNLTLNVNSTGAKTIGAFRNGDKGVLTYKNGAYFYNNAIHIFTYDGTYWLCMDWGADANTDTKVTNTLNQTAKAYVTGTTSATTNTGTQVFDTGVYLDTTAGTLAATTFKGALSGNATSASKLATARTIALTGDITGSSSFDGSGNINIGTTISNKDVVKTIKLGTDVYKAVNNVATIKAVSVSANQSLTQAEKVNARNNIDVDGARQLTYAEYQSLSADEKNNGTTYYITDANVVGDDILIVSPPTSIASIMSSVITNPASSKKIRIKLLGDSITNGAKGSNADAAGDIICVTGTTYINGIKNTVDDGTAFANPKAMRVNVGGHCWANLLKGYLEKKYNCEVLNYGCGGFSSYNIINHIYELIQDEDDIIIITIGTNDRTMVDTIHGVPTTIETYTSNLQTIYDFCKKKNKKVIFMANLPAGARNETIAGEMPESSKGALPYNPSVNGDSSKIYYDSTTGLYYRWVMSGSKGMYAEVRHFHMEDVDAAIRAFAYRNNIEYISMYNMFSDYCCMTKTKIETMLADNLHPNDNGYNVMFYLVCKALGVPVAIYNVDWSDYNKWA